ncbi:hypothetical protein ACFPRL_18150 [Pseudoclavibacter helvolus]
MDARRAYLGERRQSRPAPALLSTAGFRARAPIPRHWKAFRCRTPIAPARIRSASALSTADRTSPSTRRPPTRCT